MLGTIIRTIISRFLLLCIMIIFFIPVLIFILMPKRWRYNSRFVYFFVHLFYVAVVKSSLIPVTFEGVEHIPDEPVIFASNHQSSLDIPLIGSLTKGHPHVWLALAYLMKSPILRFILPKMTVLVDTSSPWKAMRSLLQVIDVAKETNVHIMIFPEGGRFPDEEMHDFFGGFAILAKRTGRPVIPVRIFGVNKVYPPHSFLVHWYPVKVVVGKPMVFQPDETEDDFKQRVFDWFIAQKE